jgi:hypothetical protein
MYLCRHIKRVTVHVHRVNESFEAFVTAELFLHSCRTYRGPGPKIRFPTILVWKNRT